MGLDDTDDNKKEGEKGDEENLGDMYNRLLGIKNIMLVILVISNGGVISGSMIDIVKNYNEFLNIEDPNLQKQIFRGILTHCDFNSDTENANGD